MDESNRESLTRLLTACEKENMSAVICDARFRATHCQKVGETAFRQDLREALAFYEQFSSAQYALVYDEPEKDEQWKLLYKVSQIIQEEAKQIKPFSALNHRCGKVRKVVIDRLEEYCQAVNHEVLLYNCYSQCFDVEEEREQGLENYFCNLNLFHAFAKARNLYLATSLACCGHWMDRSPSQGDLRWQLYTSLAHGVKGFYWFHPIELAKIEQFGNFREFPIDRFGNHSTSYNWLTYENNNFLELVNHYRLMEGAELEKVYHVFIC